MQKQNPPLKWAGGKRWLVPYIQPAWYKYQSARLVEPFCGGLSVALGLMPQEALLNDINPHLINFYNWLKQGLKVNTPFEDSSDIYYKYREEFNALISDHQIKSQKAAELFFYLNKTGFNGLCRFNQEGRFNVPHGQHENVNYNIDFLVFKKTFANWDFSNCSYNELRLKNNDFVFADPPYDVEFRRYSKDGFYWKDQTELIDWLYSHPGPIILCNQATERIINLYSQKGFDLHFVKERIYIKANGDRTPANVVIATRNFDFEFLGI